MTRTNKSGRPFCVVTDPATGRSLQFSPLLFDVLRRVADDKSTCMVDLNFIEGHVANSHVRMDGERWSRTGRHVVGTMSASALLQVAALG